MVRSCQPRDAEALASIYNHFVVASRATFEEEPLSVTEMTRRIEEGVSALPWVVDERNGEILGYAYAAPWKLRSAYRRTVETTVYARPGATGRGVGSALYRELLPELRRRGLHVAVATIALPNEASIALHEKFGFRPAGRLAEIGRKHGEWIDVGYWHLRL